MSEQTTIPEPASVTNLRRKLDELRALVASMGELDDATYTLVSRLSRSASAVAAWARVGATRRQQTYLHPERGWETIETATIIESGFEVSAQFCRLATAEEIATVQGKAA